MEKQILIDLKALGVTLSDVQRYYGASLFPGNYAKIKRLLFKKLIGLGINPYEFSTVQNGRRKYLWFNNNYRDSISLEELSNAGVYIQRQSLEKEIDAIFLSSTNQLSTGIYNFPDYFEYNSESHEIFLVKTKKIPDLESRFIGYLPFNVLTFLVEAANEAVCHRM